MTIKYHYLMGSFANGSTENKKEERLDMRAELLKFEKLLNDLKVQYEQYFTGILPLAPEKLHYEAKRTLRRLTKAPFKSSAMNYQLRTLKSRYQTLDTYWRRVLREREEGTYYKDVFKADLREQNAIEEAQARTAKGQAERHMHDLFSTYSSALERHTGKQANLDFDAFKKSLVQRAKDFKEKHAGKKLSFKVVVKEGKVTLAATVKN